MRYSNRRYTTSGDGGIAAIVILVLAAFGFLTFQAVRALRRPNTRDYRPVAYDTPYSHPIVADYVAALGLARLLTSVVFVVLVVIGSILLPSSLDGRLQGQRLLVLTLVILLALLGVLLSLLMEQRAISFAVGAFVLFVLVTVFDLFVPWARTAIVPLLFSAGLVIAGIAALQVVLLDEHKREVLRVWNEFAAWLLILVTVGAFYSFPVVFVLIGGLLILMLLGAAVATAQAFDVRRLLILSAFLFVVVGLVAYWLRPNTLVGVVAIAAATVLVALENVLGRHPTNQTSVIPASLLTNPALVVPSDPTLVVLPAKSKYDPQTASALIGELLKLSDRLSLSVLADGGQGITWQVAAPGEAMLLTKIAGDIQSHARDSETYPAEASSPPQVPIWRQLFLFGMVNDYAAPLPFAAHMTDHDPLAILCQRMSSLHDGERIRYQVTITTATAEAKTRAIKRLQQGKIHPLAALWQDPKNPIAGFDEKLVTAKLEYPLYHCFVSITAESPDKDRLELLGQAAQDVEQFVLPAHNRLIRVSYTRPYEIVTPERAGQPDVMRLLKAWKQEHSTPWRDVLCVLSAPEIAALWHLPSEDYQSNTIAWAHGRVPDALFDPTNGVPLGETTAPGLRGRTVYLKETDRASHHYIAGKPKAGKSTLMLRLIQADIAAGHGVAVIDPHGTLIADVIRTSIPRKRIDDVVLLEFRRKDYPVPLNPFRRPTGTTIEEASNSLMFVLQKIYDQIWQPGMTDLYMQNMVQLLLTDQDATPLDIARVFQDEPYRAQLLTGLSSATLDDVPTYSLDQFWRTYDGKKGGEQDRILSPVIHRTGVFKRTHLMELMTCHPETLDFGKMISTHKIVLLDLSGRNIYQDVDNLATLLTSGFFLAANSLGVLDDPRPRFYLYIDEIERTATAPLPQILSESRKYGLAAILANQYIEQIPEATLNAILGTVGITTIFRVGVKDARFLAPQFEPELTAADLAKLNLRSIAVKIPLEEKTLPAVILNTALPEPIEDGVQIEELQEKVTRELRPADEVRAWLDQRYGRGDGKPTARSLPPKDSTWMGTVVDVEE